MQIAREEFNAAPYACAGVCLDPRTAPSELDGPGLSDTDGILAGRKVSTQVRGSGAAIRSPFV